MRGELRRSRDSSSDSLWLSLVRLDSPEMFRVFEEKIEPGAVWSCCRPKAKTASSSPSSKQFGQGPQPRHFDAACTSQGSCCLPILPPCWPGTIWPVPLPRPTYSGNTADPGRWFVPGRKCPARDTLPGASPDVMIVVPAMWTLLWWWTERNNAIFPACFASSGRCSQNSIPGTAVSMAVNSPLTSAAAAGLGSNVSCCGGPPGKKIYATFLGDVLVVRSAWARRRVTPGVVTPSKPIAPLWMISRRPTFGWTRNEPTADMSNLRCWKMNSTRQVFGRLSQIHSVFPGRFDSVYQFEDESNFSFWQIRARCGQSPAGSVESSLSDVNDDRSGSNPGRMGFHRTQYTGISDSHQFGSNRIQAPISAAVG